MRRASMFLGLVMALASAGCGTSSAGNCATTNNGAVIQCIEYGEGYTPDQVKASCQGANASYGTGGCTSDGRVGKCSVKQTVAGISLQLATSYYPPNTTAQAMTACNQYNNASAGITGTFSTD